MRQVVIVQFEADQPQEFTLHADEAQPAADEARRWLDEQFVANDCEPLRPSGKVLTADKVMALATTAVLPAAFVADHGAPWYGMGAPQAEAWG